MNLGPFELGPNDTPENGIYCGDARELAKGIPDESVDLIFTDPVYQNLDDYRWLGEASAKVLKRGGSLIAYCAHHLTIPCGALILPYLDPAPVLEHYKTGPTARLFSHSLQCNVMPALWFTKGSPCNRWMALQQADYLTGARGHKWGKNELMLQYRIERCTSPGEVVVDFFCGGGSTPAVCKRLGRLYLAFEIDPEQARAARRRVRLTQPPLPLPVLDQPRLL